jgi:hypothetical protein
MRRDELEKHPRSHLIDLIQQHNIKGYSKLNKTQLVDLIMKNKSKIDFSKLLPTPAEQKELKKYLKSQDKKDAMKKKIEKVNLEEKTTQSPKKKATPKQMSELEQRTGKSRAEINKMSPAELVKFLPAELQEKIGQSATLKVGTILKGRDNNDTTQYYKVIEIKKGKYKIARSDKSGVIKGDFKEYPTLATFFTKDELLKGKKTKTGKAVEKRAKATTEFGNTVRHTFYLYPMKPIDAVDRPIAWRELGLYDEGVGQKPIWNEFKNKWVMDRRRNVNGFIWVKKGQEADWRAGQLSSSGFNEIEKFAEEEWKRMNISALSTPQELKKAIQVLAIRTRKFIKKEGIELKPIGIIPPPRGRDWMVSAGTYYEQWCMIFTPIIK